MKSDKWQDLERSLEKLQPFYSLMNRIMSLGNESIVRERAMDFIGNPEHYLDAGTGPGTMASLVHKRCSPRITILMDPSMDLLLMNREEGNKLQAKFENIPIRDGYFDLVTCGFSFRDAISHENAARELSRILKIKGRLVIVDIGKPDSPVLQFFYYIYIFIFPILSSLFITRGKLIHEYFTLFFTYVEYPSHSRIVEMFKSLGLELIAQGRKFGGAIFFDVYEKNDQSIYTLYQ